MGVPNPDDVEALSSGRLVDRAEVVRIEYVAVGEAIDGEVAARSDALDERSAARLATDQQAARLMRVLGSRSSVDLGEPRVVEPKPASILNPASHNRMLGT